MSPDMGSISAYNAKQKAEESLFILCWTTAAPSPDMFAHIYLISVTRAGKQMHIYFNDLK